jgi:hypothetical protein
MPANLEILQFRRTAGSPRFSRSPFFYERPLPLKADIDQRIS